LNAIRRAVRPLPGMLQELMRDEEDLVSADTKLYLRDAYDHAVRVSDLAETLQSHAMELMNLYHSTISYQMNQVMKLLTIMASIFIPTTFVAGIYGMNFDTSSPYNLPELSWRYGYPFALGLMTAIAIGMLVVFKVKRWI